MQCEKHFFQIFGAHDFRHFSSPLLSLLSPLSSLLSPLLSSPLLSSPLLSSPLLSSPLLSSPLLSSPLLSSPLLSSCLVLSCLVLSCLLFSSLPFSSLLFSSLSLLFLFSLSSLSLLSLFSLSLLSLVSLSSLSLVSLSLSLFSLVSSLLSFLSCLLSLVSCLFSSLLFSSLWSSVVSVVVVSSLSCVVIVFFLCFVSLLLLLLLRCCGFCHRCSCCCCCSHQGVFEGARNPAPHVASVLARLEPIRFSPLAKVGSSAWRPSIHVSTGTARHDRAHTVRSRPRKPLKRRAPLGSSQMLGVRTRQRRPFRAPPVMDQLTCTRFFLVSFRPVFKHGPKSLTVEQIFFVGAGTCKRLESACLDRGTSNRL